MASVLNWNVVSVFVDMSTLTLDLHSAMYKNTLAVCSSHICLICDMYVHICFCAVILPPLVHFLSIRCFTLFDLLKFLFDLCSCSVLSLELYTLLIQINIVFECCRVGLSERWNSINNVNKYALNIKLKLKEYPLCHNYIYIFPGIGKLWVDQPFL